MVLLLTELRQSGTFFKIIASAYALKQKGVSCKTISPNKTNLHDQTLTPRTLGVLQRVLQRIQGSFSLKCGRKNPRELSQGKPTHSQVGTENPIHILKCIFTYQF